MSAPGGFPLPLVRSASEVLLFLHTERAVLGAGGVVQPVLRHLDLRVLSEKNCYKPSPAVLARTWVEVIHAPVLDAIALRQYKALLTGVRAVTLLL